MRVASAEGDGSFTVANLSTQLLVHSSNELHFPRVAERSYSGFQRVLTGSGELGLAPSLPKVAIPTCGLPDTPTSKRGGEGRNRNRCTLVHGIKIIPLLKLSLKVARDKTTPPASLNLRVSCATHRLAG